MLVTDDVSSAPPEDRARRRGVAGGIVVFKAAGARADEGASLADVAAAARLANDRTHTMGVCLGPCTVPTAGVPTFETARRRDGHRDGRARRERAPARAGGARRRGVADELLDLILADGAAGTGDPLFVLVNTLGSTPVMEAFIVLRRVAERLAGMGLELHRALVGEYITSLEMAGLSLTVTALDPGLRRLLDAPARPLCAPAFGSGPW